MLTQRVQLDAAHKDHRVMALLEDAGTDSLLRRRRVSARQPLQRTRCALGRAAKTLPFRILAEHGQQLVDELGCTLCPVRLRRGPRVTVHCSGMVCCYHVATAHRAPAAARSSASSSASTWRLSLSREIVARACSVSSARYRYVRASPSCVASIRTSSIDRAWPTYRTLVSNCIVQNNGTSVNGWVRPRMFRAAV